MLQKKKLKYCEIHQKKYLPLKIVCAGLKPDIHNQVNYDNFTPHITFQGNLKSTNSLKHFPNRGKVALFENLTYQISNVYAAVFEEVINNFEYYQNDNISVNDFKKAILKNIK